MTNTNDLTPIAVDGYGELAELGRSFNTMLGTLASSRERQKRLTADAGHELRTPLTSLRTNVELLVADERNRMLPEGARADILRDIAAQLGEFTTLVGDLVHLTREDVVEPHPEPIDLRDVINSAIARAKRAGALVDLRRGTEPAVPGRRTGLPRARHHQPARQRGEVLSTRGNGARAAGG